MDSPLLHTAQSYTPSQESLPPQNVQYRLRLPSGLPAHFTPLNPLTFVLRAALIHPNKLALAHPDVQHPRFYTFAVWCQRIQNLAYALIKYGIQPGDRVAIISPNCPLIADAHWGVLAARAVVTPINFRLTKPEVDYIIEHSGSKLVLVDHEFASLAEGITVPVVISQDTGLPDDPYEKFLAEGRHFSQERGWAGLDMDPNEDANATLCYTSGTTGRPKGVMTSLRGSYLAAIANAFEAKLSFDSVYLWVLPMFHAAGWTYPWSAVFAFSTQVTIRAVRFPDIWKHFIKSGVTHYCGAPTVQIGIVNAPEGRVLERPINAVIAGSSPTSHLIGELEKKNIHVTHVYGLTDTYGPFTRCYSRPEWREWSLEKRAEAMARQGHSFATADELRVVYSDGGDLLRDVPADGKTLGEIVVRGNILMKEYFKSPEETRAALRGGFFHTGDLAVHYPDGTVLISDRSKDLIISGGENASSLAIEQELAKFPDVLEVSVIARAHPKWGERPMAFVILQPHAEARWKGKEAEFEKELKRFAQKGLPGFARPEWVKVVKDLPKTSTGKIQKNVLRKTVAKL
ncbi:hypothetical protein BOTBODRAFT_34031 [Botryobasidium botryosum FD-172 SS1]|uniref:AMP-dependent synthetase/ligase domain-containing protein n=1 Tax=Botryobasidium botryosum (strain FD-172 SS1) TaxID=930990 RepID=A0A067MAW9_BOTB1|nr:hypothetical protein BOTBODRAFT_34031 [Botryobasidium botryosum FD-172 SS1]